MPPNKIITNIYSSLSYNNIGIIHYSYGKSHIALNYFNKAQTLLSKGCTGVEDKDLQLFSSNYSSHGHKIYYNMGIVSLSVDPNQAYIILEQLKKNNTQCFDYKYWYRIGQA
jgi:tetratricopeptide (TPR) repeat protein